MQTDLDIGPAGDVWVMNNWQDIDSCFGVPPEALSTRCRGQGVTVFFGWQNQYAHLRSDRPNSHSEVAVFFIPSLLTNT